MDRLSIPNFTSILPGTDDTIWVYSGKGTTRLHAKTGSLMEAIERYSSLPNTYSGKVIQGRYLELLESYDHVLHPAEVVEPVSKEWHDDAEMDFLPGFDLLTGEKILVPAEIAFIQIFTKGSCNTVHFHVFILMDLHQAMYWRKQYVMHCVKLLKEMLLV